MISGGGELKSTDNEEKLEWGAITARWRYSSKMIS